MPHVHGFLKVPLDDEFRGIIAKLKRIYSLSDDNEVVYLALGTVEYLSNAIQDNQQIVLIRETKSGAEQRMIPKILGNPQR